MKKTSVERLNSQRKDSGRGHASGYLKVGPFDLHRDGPAGISCNKFLAKLASDYRKPNGQFAILPDQAEAFVATLPVAKFHGVGPKTASKMRALGIETGADLRRQTLDFLQDRFGKSGSWYYNHQAQTSSAIAITPASI